MLIICAGPRISFSFRFVRSLLIPFHFFLVQYFQIKSRLNPPRWIETLAVPGLLPGHYQVMVAQNIVNRLPDRVLCSTVPRQFLLLAALKDGEVDLGCKVYGTNSAVTRS